MWTVLLLTWLVSYACNHHHQFSATSGQQVLSQSFERTKYVPKGWIEIKEDSTLFTLDIRYATENNFVDEQLYDCPRCFLKDNVALALLNVARDLKNKGYKVKLLDCYRPKPVQQRLWDKVPNPSYVTPPHRGSMHNRGMAVDLTILNANGEELDMGTEYDFFGKEAHYDNLDHPEIVLSNRRLLRNTMEKFGFRGIRTEWWHFSLQEVMYPVAEWEWECPKQ